MLAYLVIREGSKWADVFRLVPGQSVTIGRAPTNQIVVKDERCSRCHAEIFFSESQWILRDLDSRNGTAVANTRVRGDYVLRAGDVVRIGQAQLRFVHDLTKAFSESQTPVVVNAVVEADRDVDTALGTDDSSVLAIHEPATITHRRGQTKYLKPDETDETNLPKVGRAAASLCRLAFELAQAPDVIAIADLALAGLFEGTQVDAGALLIVPRDFGGAPHAHDLELVAARTDSSLPYHRISGVLAATVLREGEAVLARNVMGDSSLASRDSRGVVDATSVICAPIRRGKRVFGLLHLYSTNDERVPDPDDLEFTLAVADTVAVALENLGRQEELAENLSQIRDENLQLRERLGVQSEIVGSSVAMAGIAQEIGRAAPSRATVLIRGESGVGKELVARAVHFSSPRRKGPFVCLNCAALSRSLLASELFGHEQGAFTGATQRKIGKFEAADTGTLMLDEIGEMSPTIQAKFLRVLEGHPFERVGGTETVKVDVRVIAATNRDLERDVAEGASAATCISACACWRFWFHRCANAWRTFANFRAISCSASTRRRAQAARFFAAGRGVDAQVSLAGQRPRTEKRGGACGGAGPRRRDRARRLDAVAYFHGRGHRRDARPEQSVSTGHFVRNRAEPHSGYADRHAVEQEPDGRHAGHRALDARSQDPALRAGGRTPQSGAVAVANLPDPRCNNSQ